MYMIVEYFLMGVTAFATIIIAFAAFWQLWQSNKERRKSHRLRVLRFLYSYQGKIRGAIERMPKGQFNRWNFESEIKEHYTEEFYSLHKSIQTKLRKVINEYQELQEKPEIMKEPLIDLERVIEKEINSLISKLQLDQV